MNWYLSHEGQTFGPFDEEQAKQEAKKYPQGMAWKEGFAGWVPIGSLAELNQGIGVPPTPGQVAPPPPPSRAQVADEIDYQIMGAEMQFVEIELDPGESVVAEAGAMMYKDASVEMNTI